ncbi:MAG: hypothetical protein JJT90_17470 [Ectothiorhodospiraceae bacterium]|nr:hypothetical protein [Ectothiorhodospiraceae bacterium]
MKDEVNLAEAGRPGGDRSDKALNTMAGIAGLAFVKVWHGSFRSHVADGKIKGSPDSIN